MPGQWIAKTQGDVAKFLGLKGPRQVREYISRGCPGEPGQYPLDLIVQWVRDNVWRPTVADAELLSGPSSPALEKFREKRAALAGLDLEERQNNLVQRDKIHAGLVLIASRLRAAGETLERRFGTEALRVVEETLDSCEREIEDRFGGDE